MNASVWNRPTHTSKGPIVGIDFGTSNSCIAVWNPSKKRAKVIRNGLSKRLTPSTIEFPADNFLESRIGIAETESSNSIIRELKTLLGTERTAVTCTNASGQEKEFEVEELIALIIRQLIRDAEKYIVSKKLRIGPSLGDVDPEVDFSIERAVIGIPANFSESQKNDLRQAAALAGLKEVFLMIESTAAAMAYGLLIAGSKRVLVFDMGGGTTDVSVISITDGSFTVEATEGNTACGGRVIDICMFDILLSKLKSGYLFDSETDTDSLRSIVTGDKYLFGLLMSLCRGCKEALSTEVCATIELPGQLLLALKSVNPSVTIDSKQSEPVLISVTRAEFEGHSQHIFSTAGEVATRTIATLHASSPDSLPVIDEVVLVGGSTRIPGVRVALRRALVAAGMLEFSEEGAHKEFCCSIDPDIAVAQGLSIRAAVLMGHNISTLQDILMMDTLNSSIGILSWEDGTAGCRYFDPILHRGDKMPATASKTFRVAEQGQQFVSLDIYEEIQEDCCFQSGITAPGSSPDGDQNKPEDEPTQPRYKYKRMGTYDLPIPEVELAASLTDRSLVHRLVGEINSYFGLPAGQTTKVRDVNVSLSMSVDGELSFAVSACENSCVGETVGTTNTAVVMLLVYCGAIVCLYLAVKLYFPSTVHMTMTPEL